MNTLTKEYTLLFNTITDAEEALRQLSLTLMEAQRRAEALFFGAEQGAPPGKGAGPAAPLQGENGGVPPPPPPPPAVPLNG